MAEEDKKELQEKQRSEEQWQLKEALIIIPFLASALALTWEVGCFLRIKGGAFGLFSISEHITFSLQALPIALIAAAMAVTTVFQIDLMERFIKPWMLGSPARQTNIISLSAIVIVVAVNVFLWLYSRSAVILATGVLAIAIFSAISVSPKLIRKPMVLMMMGLFGLFVTALAFGIDSARNELNSSDPLSRIVIGEKGKDAETEMNARIIRTGERGILYYEPARLRFSLVPWEKVKSIDWALSSLLTP